MKRKRPNVDRWGVYSLRGDSNSRPHHYEQGSPRAAGGSESGSQPEGPRGKGAQVPPNEDKATPLFGAPDPRLEVVCRWADEDPQAMAWLLSDAALQRLLLAAMRDLAGNGHEAEERRGEASA